jgi:hypothetical protein
MFLWEVIEGNEILPVTLQAGDRRQLAQTTLSGDQCVAATLALLASGRLSECPQLVADLRLKPFG